MVERKVFRCAIYTRKSTEFGLEQDFNSLDAQREACEAYIKSQAHEGWKLLPTLYDDGGISGGTLERPAVQTLMQDVKAGKVDIIVVYKVDRLTRSLADFAKLVELFDANNVSFVSITQQFNTTTSMGRLTLNVLLSFAQFEREVTAERIRDKIAASRQKGIWMGGTVPLGYYVKDRKLLIEETEAQQIQHVFQRYLKLPSIIALKNELTSQGYRSKPRVLTKGRTVGGIPFLLGPLAYILKNRVYVGECQHGDNAYPGQHKAILTRELFEAVQNKLANQAVVRKRGRMASNALLMGRIYDDAGNRMSPVSAQKGPIRYRFYISTAIVSGNKEKAGSIARVPAPEVEAAVVRALREQNLTVEESQSQDTVTAERQLIERHLQRVIVSRQNLAIEIAASGSEPHGGAHSDEDKPTVTKLIVPIHFKNNNPKREVIEAPDGSVHEPSGMRADSRQVLLRAICKARTWVRELTEGMIATIDDIAKRDDCSGRYIRVTLPLAFLAPDIVAAIVANTGPIDLSISRLTDGLPYSWTQQRQKYGF